MLFAIGWLISLALNFYLGVYAWYLRQKNSSFSVPTPTKRGLFRWQDGVNWHEADPIATLIAFEAHPEYIIADHSKKVCDGDMKAKSLTVKAVGDVFKVSDYVSAGVPGLTFQEKLDLMQAFIHYVNAQKKNSSD